MDNARIHKDRRTLSMIKARGYRVKFLPPYSPDLNPIELSFSVIKSFIKRYNVLGRDEKDGDDRYVYEHLLDCAYAINSDDAKGFFHHCGYL